MENSDLPESASILIRAVETVQQKDHAFAILEVILACTHPDFVMSVTNAAMLPAQLRQAVRDLISTVLLEGLDPDQAAHLFAWAQAKIMPGP